MSHLSLVVEDAMARRRRAYGQGSVRCRNGTWEIAYRPTPGAKQVWERVGREEDGADRSAAEQLLIERLAAIGRGHGAQFEGHPFDINAREWRRRIGALGDHSPSSLYQIDIALDCHLIPALGDTYLHQLTDPGIVEEYLVAKLTLAPGEPGAMAVEGKTAKASKKPLGRRSLEQQLSVLNALFSWAVRERRMSQNPVPLIEWRRVKQQGRARKDRPEPLEREQVKKLLIHARDEEQETAFLVLVSLGLRLGELFALYATDYDPATRSLHIQRTQTKERGKTLISEMPKTDAGNRVLKVSEPLHNRLVRQLARAEARPEPISYERLLFPNSQGRTHSQSNWRKRIWIPALERAGLVRMERVRAGTQKMVTPHQLRHTAASEMIARGDVDTAIAYRLGHANPQVTRMIYGHIFDRHRQQVADLADIYAHEVADIEIE